MEGVEDFIEKDAKSYGRRLIVKDDDEGMPRLLVFSKCGELIKEVCIADFSRKDINRLLKRFGLRRRTGRKRRRCKRDLSQHLRTKWKPRRRCGWRCKRDCDCPKEPEEECPRRRKCWKYPRRPRRCPRKRWPRRCRRKCIEDRPRPCYNRRRNRKRWNRYTVGSQLEE